MMASGNSRRYQMSTKAPKEEIPKLLGELVNRESNVKVMKMITEFLEGSTISGTHARSLGKCLAWMDNAVKGEETRMNEIRGLLPEKDEVIEFGKKEEQASTAQPGPEAPPVPAAAPAVGGVELSKGSEVLQPA